MIIPAIDLINGEVVRLFQGNYLNVTQYDLDPVDQLKLYSGQGAELLHIVDLDGAKNPENRQLDLIKKLVDQIDTPIQVGGGLREFSQIAELIDLGVNRVVLGSITVKDPLIVKECFEKFGPEKITLAADIKMSDSGEAFIAVSGWQKKSKLTIEAFIETYLESGLHHVLCTDISKDGTMLGPNVELYSYLKKQFDSIKFQASGGVSSLEDLTVLKTSNIDSVIIGKSLLEGTFNVEEAIKCWQSE